VKRNASAAGAFKRCRTARQGDIAVDRLFNHVAGRIASFTGRPLAFMLALGAVVVWAVTGPIFGFSQVWQLVINTGTTIVTFLMVFLVQNSQNRDAAAMQAKLDELIRAIELARNHYIGIEHMTDREIERIRDELEAECGEGEPVPSHQTIERMLFRRR
jgi:low affinity Fe/Cu permease